MPPLPSPAQLARVNRHTVSVVPSGIDGIWTVALPVPPPGLKPCKIISLVVELLLAKYRLPVVEPGTPMVIPPAPWTVRVPVKLALVLIVWPLIVPKPVIVGPLEPVTVPVMVGLVMVPPLTLRPLTAVELKLPPVMEALLILAPEVLIPPGRDVTIPLRPKVKPLALLPPMVMVPVVVVAVPTSIVMLPELEVLPLALPVLILKDEELVEAVLVLAVARSGACRPVAK
jgi:hypothetical protein